MENKETLYVIGSSFSAAEINGLFFGSPEETSSSATRHVEAESDASSEPARSSSSAPEGDNLESSGLRERET